MDSIFGYSKGHRLSVIEEQITCKGINVLCQDVLIAIFEYLPLSDRVRIERVSRLWRRLSKQSYGKQKALCLNRKFLGLKCNDNYDLSNAIDCMVLEHILKRCGRYLKSIDLTHVHYRNALSYVAEYCSDVRIIKFNGTTPQDIEKLSKKCKNIEQLFVNDIIISSAYDEPLGNLFCSCKSLRTLELSLCEFRGQCFSKLSASEIQRLKIVSFCTSAEYMDVNFLKNAAGIKWLEISGYGSVIATALESLSVRSTNVTELALEVYNRPEESGASYLTDADMLLSRVFERNKGIASLRLASFKSLKGTCLLRLNGICLKELFLYDCVDNIGDKLLGDCLSKFEQLESLELRDFPAERTFTNTLECVSLLKNLKNFSLNNVEVESEVALMNVVKSLKRLKSLTVIGPRVGIVTDRFCAFLVEYLPQISKVDFSYNDLITDGGIQFIVQLKNLQVLNLVECANITGSGLICSSELKELNLAGCTNLKEQPLIQMFEREHALELVNLSGFRGEPRENYDLEEPMIRFMASEESAEKIVQIAIDSFYSSEIKCHDCMTIYTCFRVFHLWR